MAIPNVANIWKVSRTVFRSGWREQPVLMVSCLMGVVGPLFVAIGPGLKHWNEEIANWPTHYRLPPSK